MSKIVIGNDDFNTMVYTIAWQIEQSEVEYDFILAPCRGGLIPGVLLSHILGLPLIPISWTTYHDKQIVPNALPEPLVTLIHQKTGCKILIVEDIVDTGGTTTQIVNALSDVYFGREKMQVDIAALVYNTSQPMPVAFSAMQIDRNEEKRWIDFWWEKDKL